ncbi:shikimate dehydrogenase [Brachybacterium sp. P6-10-X1]|uniref:shikimate dehydrogenase n=1 Tax=Brachybacterium sp. P6-10-X1 TaxID=1903186 RepID=UPI000971877A|nr:shikimate dehydrogenase [Brachybacterium sp. P6-10-X1]APX31963.1 shikimate dehydrogenase [Brachybacterium sp. P6-10-X1]
MPATGIDAPATTLRRFAVVGSPVVHSLSPVLHRTAYAELGIERASYDRYDVPAGELAAFLETCPGRELAGLSVTMPGKPEAFALAAETDATSRELGIANTLIRRPDEDGWRAENHDVHGIVAALGDHGTRTATTGAVLGSGATATSAVAALVELGTERILLSARSPHKLAAPEEVATRAGVSTSRVPWDSSQELLAADVLISALAADGARAVADAWERTADRTVPTLFLDVLYDPWPAPLAAVIAARGGDVADGLEMLAHQAGQQVRSMLSVPSAPVPRMLAAARDELARRAG